MSKKRTVTNNLESVSAAVNALKYIIAFMSKKRTVTINLESVSAAVNCWLPHHLLHEHNPVNDACETI